MYYRQNKIIYWVTHFGFRIYAKLFLELKVEGAENIPTEGGAIIAPNHLSYYEPPLIAVSILKRTIYFMGKESLLKKPVTGWLLKVVGTFPVRRGEADIKALKIAVRLLKSGEAVLIFPEGKRGDGIKLLEAMPGIGGIACMSGVPVIPVLITGSNKIHLFRKSKAMVKIGKPLYYGRERKKGREGYREFGREIMSSIEKLDTDGFYSK